MTSNAERILKEALALSTEERASIAVKLLESVPDEDPATVAVAWREEIADRIDELERGDVDAESWDEVQRKTRALLGSK